MSYFESPTQAQCTFLMQICLTGWIEVRMLESPAIRLSAPAIWLQAPGVPTAYCFRNGSRIAFLHLTAWFDPAWDDFDFAGEFDLQLPGRRAFMQPSPRDLWGVDVDGAADAELARRAGAALPPLLGDAKSGDRRNQLDLRLLATALLSDWAATAIARAAQPAAIPSDALDAIRQARLVIQLEHGARFNVGELAASAGLERSRFTRLFHRHFLVHPGKFARDCRMKQAAHLLTTSRDSIERIAHRSGYADGSAFRRVFRQVFGLTPEQYRRESRSAVPKRSEANLKRRRIGAERP